MTSEFASLTIQQTIVADLSTTFKKSEANLISRLEEAAATLDRYKASIEQVTMIPARIVLSSKRRWLWYVRTASFPVINLLSASLLIIDVIRYKPIFKAELTNVPEWIQPYAELEMNAFMSSKALLIISTIGLLAWASLFAALKRFVIVPLDRDWIGAVLISYGLTSLIALASLWQSRKGRCSS